MSQSNCLDRRVHARFHLDAMYTQVTIQRVVEYRIETLEGHAYDVSESGVRIELDKPLELGERVALHLGLPGEDLAVFASARVIWVNPEDDDPGPRRMALEICEFISQDDRDRLLRFLGSGLLSRVA